MAAILEIFIKWQVLEPFHFVERDIVQMDIYLANRVALS